MSSDKVTKKSKKQSKVKAAPIKAVEVVAPKVEKKSKKSKKVVVPSSSSSSSESDNDETTKVAKKDSSSSSSSSSDSESEAAPVKIAKESSSSSSSESSDSETEAKVVVTAKKESSSSSSDSESDDETPVAAKLALAKKESSSSSSDSESDAEAPVAKVETKSSSGSSSSSSSSDSENEEVKEEIAPKKRKAEEETPVAEKKVAVSSEEGGDTTCFIGNLSWNVDEAMLAECFKDCGEVKATRIITERDTGRSKGFGYVEFNNAASAQAAIAKTGTLLDNREIRVDISISKPKAAGGQRFEKPASEPSPILFMGNLAFSVTEEEIRSTFGEFGEIKSCRFPTDKETGAFKGYGYLEYGSVGEAQAAVEALNGKDICGRGIRLDYSQPRNDAGGAPRGGRGGRGGARGGRGGNGRGARGGAPRGRGSYGAQPFAGKKTTF